MSKTEKESWGSGDPYALYVGRWSRKVALKFLPWIGSPQGATWADVGCGTGVLAECILALCNPKSVSGIDRSEGFVLEARRRVRDSRTDFRTGDATALPWEAAAFDFTISGLVLNFVPDHAAMVKEMARVTRPSGTVAAYVWDYAGKMEMMRYFWDAALAVSPQDSKLDQAERFPVCQPQPLMSLFKSAGLNSVLVDAIEVPTVFRDFEDYWQPFLGKQGAAPTYLASVDEDVRSRIRETLREMLPAGADGRIQLTAKAWAVRGIR